LDKDAYKPCNGVCSHNNNNNNNKGFEMTVNAETIDTIKKLYGDELEVSKGFKNLEATLNRLNAKVKAISPATEEEEEVVFKGKKRMIWSNPEMEENLYLLKRLLGDEATYSKMLRDGLALLLKEVVESAKGSECKK